MSTKRLPQILNKIQALRQGDCDEDTLRVVEEAEQQLKSQGRELRKARHDFQTVAEVARRLNSQGLDLGRIETFVNRLLMGQFAANKAFFARQSDFADGVFRCQRDSQLDVHFDQESPITAWLLGLRMPTLVADCDRELENLGILECLRRSEVEVISPLIRSEQDRRTLEGVLFLGKRITGMPYEDSDLMFLGLTSDLVAIALHNASLFFASTHDSLTKIFGRGHFDLTIDQEILRARRYGEDIRRVSLAMVDVDHFKRFNDTYGHVVGDEVLRQVAKSLAETVRKIDVVARYGGEEFAIIFPEIRRDEAKIAAERVRAAIERLDVRLPGIDHPLKVTVSIGVATFPEDATERQALINRADSALYRAKETRRNCVVLADRLPPAAAPTP